jgi:hypothetical protein
MWFSALCIQEKENKRCGLGKGENYFASLCVSAYCVLVCKMKVHD